MTDEEQQFLLDLQTIHFSIPQMLNAIENASVSFEFVFSIALSHKQPQARYCTWIISHYLPNHKTAIDAYIDQIIAFIPHINHSGHRREMLRWLTLHLPHNAIRLGELFDTCVRFLYSETNPIGVKTHALTILEIIVKRHPELLPEYKELLNDILPISERSITRKIRKQINALLV